MAEAGRSTRPHAVLFACGLNSVRSPMAVGLFRQIIGPASYVSSAGVRKDELDPFAVARSCSMSELERPIESSSSVTATSRFGSLGFCCVIAG